MSRGERKAMIAPARPGRGASSDARGDSPARPGLSLSRQCRLLSISRSAFYYAPKGESPENLALMRRIDELFLQYPFYGSRQMMLHLQREGIRAGRHRVRRLMRLMGLEAIYQMHRNVSLSDKENAPAEFIANQEEKCAGEYIKLSVAPDAKSYTVTVGSKGTPRRYQTRPRN